MEVVEQSLEEPADVAQEVVLAKVVVVEQEQMVLQVQQVQQVMLELEQSLLEVGVEQDLVQYALY